MGHRAGMPESKGESGWDFLMPKPGVENAWALFLAGPGSDTFQLPSLCDVEDEGERQRWRFPGDWGPEEPRSPGSSRRLPAPHPDCSRAAGWRIGPDEELFGSGLLWERGRVILFFIASSTQSGI